MSIRCCLHPVERHAYNGCADCSCGVRWPEHPDRDKDTSPVGIVERLHRAEQRLVAVEAERDNAVTEFLDGHARRLAEMADQSWEHLDGEARDMWAAEVHDILNRLVARFPDGEVRDGRSAVMAERAELVEDVKRVEAERDRLRALLETCLSGRFVTGDEVRRALGMPSMCPKRLGIPGAWPCVLDAGHERDGVPHRDRCGQESTKIWDGALHAYVKDAALAPTASSKEPSDGE